MSATLEQLGSSAYAGAARYISNKDYLMAAATTLSTEARQAAWIESAVRHGSAWGTAYEVRTALYIVRIARELTCARRRHLTSTQCILSHPNSSLRVRARTLPSP